MHCNNGLNNKLVESLVENKVAQETGDLKYLQESMYDFISTIKEIILGEYSPEFFNKYVDEALKLHGSNLEEFLKIPKMGLELRQALENIDAAIDTSNQEFKDNLVLLLDRFQTTLDNIVFEARDAYETALDNGFKGTKQEWLKHLEGDSAYKIATLNGFKGTEQEWLKHLEGDSAYEIAVKNGYKGTQAEWLKYIRADGFIQSIQQFATNDSETKVQIPDYGTINSLQGYIKELFENGGLPATPFKTKALMTASSLPDGKYAMVTDDTVNNGLYVKTAGTWVKSGYDPLSQAKSYIDTAKSEAIAAAATDATSKADATEANAKTYADDEVAGLKSHLIDYTDSRVGAIDFSTPRLTGEQIYNKALEDTNQPFSAIWTEYNKPVWHIGNLVFIDAIGAEVDVVEREFVVTIRLSEDNQKFYFPASRVPVEYNTTIDWGDGTIGSLSSAAPNHTYSGLAGDEYVITVKGRVDNFGGSGSGNVNIISIDKNTLPKTTTVFNISRWPNLESVCDGAFSSFAGDSFNLDLARYQSELQLTTGMFKGLTNVVNIDNLLSAYGRTFDGIIPQGLLDPFVNVESAANIFAGTTSKIPSDILRNMPKLKHARRLFYSAKSPESDLTEVFKYQKNLDNVSECFKFSTAQGDALKIYQDIARGNPREVQYCFNSAYGMTNTKQVPAGWK